MCHQWNKETSWETPYVLRFGKKSDMSMQRAFGDAAYVYHPKETCVNEQAPRSELMIFIGYTSGMNAYHFMHTHNNSISTSSNAIFDERWFPHCSVSKPPFDVSDSDFKENSEPSESAPENNNDDPELPLPDPPTPHDAQNDSGNEEGDEEIRGGGDMLDQGNADQGGDGAMQPPPNPFNPRMAPELEHTVRCSERVRACTQRPGNIYGDRSPAEIDRSVD